MAEADEVPLVADELEAVWIDGALQLLVAADRVVAEDDAIAVGDRGLEFGEGDDAGACLREDGELRRRRVLKEFRPALNKNHEREPQRFGVGEAVLEHREAGGERREFR